jgi:hypothetical protein
MGAKTLVKDADWPSGKAAVDFYFIQDDGDMFKCTYQYEPYFYIGCKVSRLKVATVFAKVFPRTAWKARSKNG